MKSLIYIFLAIVILFSGCADAQHVEHCVKGHVYGFWGGIWHGSIMFFSLIGSWFNDDIAVYAINNNGGWYNLGFVFGIGGLLRLIRALLSK